MNESDLLKKKFSTRRGSLELRALIASHTRSGDRELSKHFCSNAQEVLRKNF